MASRQKTLLEEFNKAFNRHDIDSMLAMMTDDCLFENTYPPPDGTEYRGQADVRRFWEGFLQSSPQAQIEIEEMLVTDNWGVQRWVYHWVDSQGIGGHVRGVDVFRFREGKIASKLSYVKG